MYVRLELSRIHAIQKEDELSRQMYESILEQMGRDRFFDETGRTIEVMKHIEDDKTKENHGKFTRKPAEILEEIKGQLIEENICESDMVDIYQIRIAGCGIAGGKNGDGHRLDYVTVVTMPQFPDKVLTMFPSDNIFELEQEIKNPIGHKNGATDNGENDGGDGR